MLTAQGSLNAALLLFVAAAAFIDWRTHRIPNLLCAIGGVVGMTFQLWMHGENGLRAGLGGATVGFAMFLPFYMVRAFGAGDVKAMSTVGTFLGMQGAAVAVGMTLIAGALLGVAVLLLSPASVAPARHRLMLLLVSPKASIQSSRHETNPQSRQRFPYGVAIACGTAAALVVLTR